MSTSRKTRKRRSDERPPSLPRQILLAAERWKRDADWDLPFSDPEFDVALDGAMSGIASRLGPETMGFLSDLATQASSTFEMYWKDDGDTLVCEGSLFLVPVYGPASAILSLTNDGEAFTALARSFRESGVFHPASSSITLPLFVDVRTLADLSPGRLAILTEILAEAMAPMLSHTLDGTSAADLAAEVEDFLDLKPLEDEDAMLPGAFLGMRFVVWPSGSDPNECPMDDLSFCDDPNDSTMRWRTASPGIVPEGTMAEAPGSWPRSVVALAFMDIAMKLSALRAQSSVPAGTMAEVVHLHVGPDEVLVAFDFGERGVVGPASVPWSLVAADAEEFMARIGALGEGLVSHDTIARFLSVFGERH